MATMVIIPTPALLMGTTAQVISLAGYLSALVPGITATMDAVTTGMATTIMITMAAATTDDQDITDTVITDADIVGAPTMATGDLAVVIAAATQAGAIMAVETFTAAGKLDYQDRSFGSDLSFVQSHHLKHQTIQRKTHTRVSGNHGFPSAPADRP